MVMMVVVVVEGSGVAIARMTLGCLAAQARRAAAAAAACRPAPARPPASAPRFLTAPPFRCIRRTWAASLAIQVRHIYLLGSRLSETSAAQASSHLRSS